MTQQQLIALFEERQRLAASPVNASAYGMIVMYLKAQVLYTKSEVELLCRAAHEAGSTNAVLSERPASTFTQQEWENSEIEHWLQKNLTKSV